MISIQSSLERRKAEINICYLLCFDFMGYWMAAEGGNSKTSTQKTSTCPVQIPLESLNSYSVSLGYTVELPLWYRWGVLLCGICHDKDLIGRTQRPTCSSSGIGLWAAVSSAPQSPPTPHASLTWQKMGWGTVAATTRAGSTSGWRVAVLCPSGAGFPWHTEQNCKHPLTCMGGV